RIGPDPAQAFADRAGTEAITDWRRSMLGGFHYVTVEGCGRYGYSGVAEDEDEMLRVWKLQRGADLDPDFWLEAIQKEPAPSPVIRENGSASLHVLDLGLWNSFERRQVLGQLLWDSRCFGMYGLDEAGRKNGKAAARNYGRLDTYALV